MAQPQEEELHSMTINWFTNEQQVDHMRINFDAEIVGVVEIKQTEIDRARSLQIGQNRIEGTLHQESIERMARLVNDGVPLPRVLVWKPKVDAPRVVVLDGNHRLEVAFAHANELTAQAILITSEELVAQNIARVVNTQHGRSAMTHEYMAMTMRTQRAQGVPNSQIGRMWGFSEGQVATITRRDEQTERVQRLFPERKAKVKESTLDIVTTIEDGHLVLLGDPFLDAPRSEQQEVKRRILEAASADRMGEAQRQAGWLQAKAEDAKKVRPKMTKPSSDLQTVLTRASSITDIPAAFYQSTDAQKAKMADQLGRILPALERLWTSIKRDVAA